MKADWADWKSLAMELFVVFIGLLGALQVDDWRQRRELAQTETVYLQRLSADLKSYVAFLNEAIPRFEEKRSAVAQRTSSKVGSVDPVRRPRPAAPRPDSCAAKVPPRRFPPRIPRAAA